MYVPQTINTRRAVLVWFPSYFKHGCASDYGGQHLVKEDIIVVVVNFRLGIYGFSCLNEPAFPGNTALRDQDAALRWIKNYIHKFGGDPHAVTIGGQGYGGGFVDIHMYSEFERLYDKAIIQSGSIFAKGFFGKSNPSSVLKIAKHLGQTIGRNTRPRDVLPFLSKIDPVKLLNVSNILDIKVNICKEQYYKSGIQNFITKGPHHLNKLDKIKDTKILVGYNSMELLGVYVQDNNNTPEFYKSLGNVFYKRISQTFQLSEKEKQELTKRIRKFYLGGQEMSPATRIQLIESSSDLYVNHPVEMSVDRFIHAGATVYKYLFSYTGDSQFKNIKGSGASNEEELKYLFEMKTKIKGGEGGRIRNTLIRLWANFVKYGNPSPKGKPSWSKVTGESRPYLDINSETQMKNHVFRQRMAFLDLLFYSYRKKVMVH
ncbi:unnamed protein product [Arctia plantaginis]|uniref:Carboxylesterase type B domain-containing protein n=1 Tax=Arctia plantaginis TaxID=874455 RepID=A0A8S0ZEH7_ARCPL|nr:unnamed protein product [Arctia plantaginis]